MNTDLSARITELQRHEEELVFASFTYADAWRLGSLLAERGLAAGHAIGIDIRRPGLILFRAALPGATAYLEEWIAGSPHPRSDSSPAPPCFTPGSRPPGRTRRSKGH